MNRLNMNTDSFRKSIAGNTPVLVEFSATWCSHCRRLQPVLEQVVGQYQGRLVFGQIDIDREPTLADEEQVEVVPTLLIYQDSRVLGSIVAPESKSQLEEFIEEALDQKKEQDNEQKHIYDMIVIGGGPSGYTAALYATRAGLDTLVLEKMSAGGQMTQTAQIDNYPGFDQGIDGFELGERMRAGAERFGAKTEIAEVYSAVLKGDIKRIETSEGTFLGKTVVTASGAEHKHLGVDKEKQYVGRGVAYCAACDGMFYKGKTVAVVGGGNSAVADAMVLSRICDKVILIHRRDRLRTTKIYHDQLKSSDNIEFRWNSTVHRLLGENKLSALQLRDVNTGELTELQLDGVFISVGRAPATELFKDQVELDKSGYIVADESTKTNIPGVYAVGDVRTKALRQVITAAADGAVAAHYVEMYLTQ